MKEEHKIVKESGGYRISIANSATSIDENNKNDVVVDGSHFGLNVGKYAAQAGIKGMIGNDAGKGLDNAGIAGMEILDDKGIPGAAVAAMSARIGNGTSTYEEGEISVVNETARKLGITPGMSARDAADRMFEAALKGK